MVSKLAFKIVNLDKKPVCRANEEKALLQREAEAAVHTLHEQRRSLAAAEAASRSAGACHIDVPTAGQTPPTWHELPHQQQQAAVQAAEQQRRHLTDAHRYNTRGAQLDSSAAELQAVLTCMRTSGGAHDNEELAAALDAEDDLGIEPPALDDD